MVCGVSDALFQMLLVHEIENQQPSCFSDIDGNLIAGGRVGKQQLGVLQILLVKFSVQNFKSYHTFFGLSICSGIARAVDHFASVF
jgi:hypothetical protein